MKRVSGYWDFKKDVGTKNSDITHVIYVLKKALRRNPITFGKGGKKNEDEIDPLVYIIYKFLLGVMLVELAEVGILYFGLANRPVNSFFGRGGCLVREP